MSRIDDFRAQLIGGGARPDHFRVTLTAPPGIVIPGANNALNKVQFMAKATSLPASQIQPIPVFYRGRETKVAGDRVFNNWNVTIINDADFAIRNFLESWSNGISNHVKTNGAITSSTYQTDFEVVQLDKNDNILKSYVFRNAWPINIGEIGLDFQNNNSIEEFQVEFSIDYWTSNTTDQIG